MGCLCGSGKDGPITIHELAELHYQLNKAKINFYSAEGVWDRSKRDAFYVMDVLDGIQSSSDDASVEVIIVCQYVTTTASWSRPLDFGGVCTDHRSFGSCGLL